MKSNIILIGMPGCGKSTVGVILAKTLGLDFVDTDLLICRREGKTLQRILDESGHAAFLKIESEVLRGLDRENSVIATGGSAVLCPAAMERLGELGCIVFIDVPLKELERRINNITTRGIAFEPGQGLRDVYELRAPLYRKYCDVSVSPPPDGENSIELVAEGIVSALKGRGDCNL